MMEIQVQLNTVNNAVLFTAKCGEYQEDIDYLNNNNKHIVDAKSLVGVIALGIDHPCTVRLHTDNTDLFNKFREDIKLWILN